MTATQWHQTFQKTFEQWLSGIETEVKYLMFCMFPFIFLKQDRKYNAETTESENR